MKHTITELEAPKESILFINSILGNYCFDTFLGDFPVEESPVSDDSVLELLFYTHEPTLRDEEHDKNVLEPIQKESFWTLHFDGSKTKEGIKVGCVLIDPRKDKPLNACRLEFYCTYNIVEHEVVIQGLRKAIDLGIKNLKVFGDSKIIVK